jgi:hypothetical protein
MRVLLLLAAAGLTASSSRIITFDNAAIGKAPAGWIFSSAPHGGQPHWEIRKDQTARTQPYVLAQVSSGPSDHSPLAILDGLDLRDADVSVRIKPLSGKEAQAAGVVWRYRDENNYYFARANAAEKNVSVFKVENGRRSAILPGVKHEISPNEWCILKVSARGNRFQIYMDHRRILQGQDNTFTGAGKVGLWTVADSVTYFDDFRVYPK